jgi:hypothetical protein
MPVTPYLDDRQFDPETKRVMGLAFEMACIALGLTDRDNLIKQMVANNIIERWKTGEGNPDVLCEQVVKDLRRSAGGMP